MAGDTSRTLTASLSPQLATSTEACMSDSITVSRWPPPAYIGDRQSLKIAFNRTVRVSDNGEMNALPPGLGRFPVYQTDDFNNLPANMHKKGGFFIPMYQREAMWIGFHATQPFAIKVHNSSVNAVSGEPAREMFATARRRRDKLKAGRSIQDYVVAPDQLWLDGIASDDGNVRQFVAMPLGQGYTVEAQITGEEVVGGIQIEVTPSKFPTHIINRINPKPGKEHWYTVTVKTLTGKSLNIQVSAEHTIYELKTLVQDFEGIPPDQQRLICRQQLEDCRTLKVYGIFADSIIHLVLHLRGGGNPELGIAAGGLIRQEIIKDKHDPAKWEPSCGTVFNVQILNSAMFKKVTGTIPPDSPVRATTYAKYGFPYFAIYDEKPSGIKGDFDGVKSVNELDGSGKPTAEKAKAVAEVAESTANPVVVLDFKCDKVGFRPLKKMEEELRERFGDLGL